MKRLEELLNLKDLELTKKLEEADEWVQKYQDLKNQLATVSDDSELSNRAGQLIEKGEFEQAGAILNQLIEKQEHEVDALARSHFNRAELYMLQFHRFEVMAAY